MARRRDRDRERGGGGSIMLYDLRTFNKDKASYDELVELSAFGRAIRQEFEALGGEVPDWVDRQIKALRREIHSRHADAAEAKLSKAKARYAGLLKESLTRLRSWRRLRPR